MLTAIIKPFRFDEVKAALAAAGINDFLATEVKKVGRGQAHTELYRGAEYVTDSLPKIQVTAMVNDDKCDEIVQAILKAAHTGRTGDGSIAVTPVEQYWSIGTGLDEIKTNSL